MNFLRNFLCRLLDHQLVAQDINPVLWPRSTLAMKFTGKPALYEVRCKRCDKVIYIPSSKPTACTFAGAAVQVPFTYGGTIPATPADLISQPIQKESAR